MEKPRDVESLVKARASMDEREAKMELEHRKARVLAIYKEVCRANRKCSLDENLLRAVALERRLSEIVTD